MKLEEKTLDKEYVYHGKIINVRRDKAELPNGETAYREIVEHRGGVCVLPMTDNDEILMVRQFRYPYMQELLEIPAGKRDSYDEKPLDCGKRELKEETGATSDNFVFLGEFYPTPAYVDEIIYVYYADNLDYGETKLDDDEFLEIVKVPFEKAVEMVLSGEIKDGKTTYAIMKTALLKQQNKL